jgi:hypothetical protein
MLTAALPRTSPMRGSVTAARTRTRRRHILRIRIAEPANSSHRV